MPHDSRPAPKTIQGVTVSSTLTDLKDHRAALIKVIRREGLADVAMENDATKPDVDVIESSLQMVRDGAAYIGIISLKYGQVPRCPVRNPEGRSITELEFDEAQRLGRPILLFIMGDDHPGRKVDFEASAAKEKKLKAFRERAKRMSPDSFVHRVYATFDSLEEFKEKAAQSVVGLRRYLDQHPPHVATEDPQQAAPASEGAPAKPEPMPVPPALHAEPPYIGSHAFVGRRAQLEMLSDWAAAADPHPVLLFEAIGGTGKSMLTWEWTTKHAVEARGDWAGRFWYSFYERGAIMADFCQRALAYITGQPVETFRKKRTPELGEVLLRHLQARPWLLVLDGLERVLVAYHRIDAAQIHDEEAGTTDEIAQRDPCAAIRPEDDDLLRALAAAAPSKLLLTTRLTPRVLLNAASQPIPGVLRDRLPGLRPPDAEALVRACGVTGTSPLIQDYLQRHCDCHPLVTGVLAGLINDYLPDRGNFDAWAKDPEHGGHLDLAGLDLVQKRNHILNAAIAVLPEKSRQLLSTLALLSESVDYATLSALNPHLPPEPEPVAAPQNPVESFGWPSMAPVSKAIALEKYAAEQRQRDEYERSLKRRRMSQEFHAAPHKLSMTVKDLERRGLLQYDVATKRHDLHPVVRGLAAGGLQREEKEQLGQRVVDHFSQQAQSPYFEAETLDDVRSGLHVVRTFIAMERLEEAILAYGSGLYKALFENLEAYAEILSILRPLFPHGWSTLPARLDDRGTAGFVAAHAALALQQIGEHQASLVAYGAALGAELRDHEWSNVRTIILNMAELSVDAGQLAQAHRNIVLAFDVADLSGKLHDISLALLHRFEDFAERGLWDDAKRAWLSLRERPAGGRYGTAEVSYAWFSFWRGQVTEAQLADAYSACQKWRNRLAIRSVLELMGFWLLTRNEWTRASQSLTEAVRMAREVGHRATAAEHGLALARFQHGELHDARQQAEHLSARADRAQRLLAELWLAIGDEEQAKTYALEAYRWAWADGEPFVRRYELDKSRDLLEKLGMPIPTLPRYDPARHETPQWEADVRATLTKLQAKKKGLKDNTAA